MGVSALVQMYLRCDRTIKAPLHRQQDREGLYPLVIRDEIQSAPSFPGLGSQSLAQPLLHVKLADFLWSLTRYYSSGLKICNALTGLDRPECAFSQPG